MRKLNILLSVFILFGLPSIAGCRNGEASLPPINSDSVDEEINPEYLTFYRRGAENPKVILEEYSDFFCPHCAHVQPTVDQLLEEYKDILALEYHHFSFMGSGYVHLGNECAGDQGKFWEFHEEAFKNQSDLRMGGKNAVIKMAEDLGLDKEQFEECLLDMKYEDKIIAQTRDGKEKYDISGTPSFVVNGVFFDPTGVGSYYEGLKEAIEKAITQPKA